MSDIRFPQGPMVGPDGYVTLEWEQWFQNPQFVSFTLPAVVDVTSGGTGTGTLTAHGVLVGNGTGAISITAVGGTNTILQGNTGADPTYKNTINAIAIGGTTPAAAAFTTIAASGTSSLAGVTATSVAATGAISSSGTAGVGYATGAGGTVNQGSGSGKSTAVQVDKICGTITMDGALLAAGGIVTFTVTNATCAATDVICVQHDSVGTTGAYTIAPNTPSAGSFKISVRNNTAAGLSEAIVIRFAIIKAVVT